MHFAICILQLAFTPPAFAQPDPPVLGRPKGFSGLVGQYSISAFATPTQVRVEEPITLTVRITAFDPKSLPPERSRLHLFPDDFSKNFYVEEIDGRHPWEVIYRLRPKHADVKLLPSLKLVYYHPGRQKFQATYSEAIEVTVSPQKQAGKNLEDRPRLLFDLPSVGHLMNPVHPPRILSWEVVLIVLVIPPIACLYWSLAVRKWQRAGHLNSNRRRLRILDELRRPGVGVETVIQLVNGYLSQRTGLRVAVPTPSDIAEHLRRIGIGRALCAKCADFFEQCDAALFAPSGHLECAMGVNLADTEMREAAIRLIMALEGEPCLRHWRA